MKCAEFWGKVAARFVSASLKRRKGVKIGGGEKITGSRKARLEALESRELLDADALSGALDVLSSDSDVVCFAREACLYNVPISSGVSADSDVLVRFGTIGSTNATISGNTGEGSVAGTFAAYNSTTASNEGSDISQQVGCSLQGSNSLLKYASWIEGDNYVYDSTKPLFVDAANGDYRLATDSQAIDKGSDSLANEAGLTVDSTDLEGESRFVGDSIDIGAYEYQNVTPVYSTVVDTLNDSFDLSDDEWSLREAIYCLDAGSTITFAEDLNGTIALTQGELVVDKVLTIDGDGRITIDANQQSRVFSISGGTSETPVQLKGLTITGGKTSDVGGAIYNDGTTTATRCEFVRNTASYGGALYNLNSLTCVNCVVSQNVASGDGGAVWMGGAASFVNCTIAGNVAKGNVGGICVYANKPTLVNTILACNFAENRNYETSDSTCFAESSNNAIGFDPGFEVAPTFDENGEITNADVIDLRLKSNAWAIDRGDNSAITEETDFAGNARVVAGYSETATVDIGAFEFQERTKKTFETASTVVTTMLDVVDDVDGLISLREAIYYATEGATITFADSMNGKTLELRNGTQLFVDRGLTVDASSLSDGFTIDGNKKSNVFTISGATTLKNLTITGGYSCSSGGGIYATAPLTLVDCSVLSNEADYVGGGIYSTSDVTVERSTFSGNKSHTNGSLLGGGAIYDKGGTVNVKNSTFDSNETVDDGGAIMGNNSVLTIEDSSFLNNKATNCGGAVGATGGTFVVSNSNFSGNSSKYGGAIYTNCSTYLLDCSIYSNQAYDGGAVATASGDKVIAANTTISKNTATHYGGGVYVASGTFTSTNATISENGSKYGGGVFVNTNGAFTSTSTTISGNIGNTSGGGVYVYKNGSFTSTNTTISGNIGNYIGGGVYVYKNGSFTSTNTTIVRNGASTAGGGVYVSGTFTAYNTSVVLSSEGVDVYNAVGVIQGSNNLSTYTDWAESGNYEYDPTKPLFKDAENGDYRLAVDSQAIDRGSDARANDAGLTVDSTDLAGKPRFNGDSIDIGAYEFYDAPNEPGCLTLGVYNVTTRTVAMSWQDNSDDETGFRVEYSTDGGKTWRLSEQLGANATSRVAWGVKQNATYDFRVCALKGTKRSDWIYSETLDTTVRIPQAPSDLTPGVYDATTQTVTLTWQDNSDNETGFRVEYSTDDGRTWRLSQIMDANATSRVASSVKPDSTYAFRICALLGGLKSKWAYSEILDTSEEETEESCVPTFGVSYSPSPFDVPYRGVARALALPVAAPRVEQAPVCEIAFENFAEEDAFAPFDYEVEFAQDDSDNFERDEAFVELFDNDLLAIDL